MSLSSHFQKSPIPENPADLSWISAASLTPVGVPQPSSIPTRESKIPSEPKDILPSKGISTYMKNVRFNAYKSTRPALLQEINTMIDHDRKILDQKFGQNLPKGSILQSYSAAFARYIEESTLYKSFLSEVKRRYGEAVSECHERSQLYDELDIMLKARDESHQNQLKDALEESTIQIKDLESKLESSRELAKSSAISLSKLTVEHTKLQEVNQQLRKDLDAGKVTIGLLSAQLARLAEDKLKSDAQESAHLLELAHLRQLETTLNNELDRYSTTVFI